MLAYDCLIVDVAAVAVSMSVNIHHKLCAWIWRIWRWHLTLHTCDRAYVSIFLQIYFSLIFRFTERTEISNTKTPMQLYALILQTPQNIYTLINNPNFIAWKTNCCATINIYLNITSNWKYIKLLPHSSLFWKKWEYYKCRNECWCCVVAVTAHTNEWQVVVSDSHSLWRNLWKLMLTI